jgi:hypothetical protein
MSGELRMTIVGLLLAAVCCAVSSTATMWWINPVQDLNQTQAVVMKEYLAAFCVKDDRHDIQFVVGTAAALTRIAVKANLGHLALTEYAQCRLWTLGRGKR